MFFRERTILEMETHPVIFMESVQVSGPGFRGGQCGCNGSKKVAWWSITVFIYRTPRPANLLFRSDVVLWQCDTLVV